MRSEPTREQREKPWPPVKRLLSPMDSEMKVKGSLPKAPAKARRPGLRPVASPTAAQDRACHPYDDDHRRDGAEDDQHVMPCCP